MRNGLIQCYTPTKQAELSLFYAELQNVVNGVKRDTAIIISKVNARVGPGNLGMEYIKHNIGKVNEYG